MSFYQRVCFLHYHEIGLKGHNRGRFLRCLISNVEYALEKFPTASVGRISGHIVIDIPDDVDATEVADLLCQIPGIVKVSTGYRTERDIDQLCEASCLVAADAGNIATFKIAGKRSNTDFAYDSRDINNICGAAVQKAYPQLAVNCSEPDCCIEVQVIQSFGYVFAKRFDGVGGLPVGSAGKVLSLLSAGIDSPVATWKMLRRGAVATCVHFSGRPQTTDDSEYLVRDIIEKLNVTSGIDKLYTCAIGDYQREISLAVPPKLRVIMYRRLMLLVAQRFAEIEDAKAIVTGESLGQVASQTLDNIHATDEVASLPVFRPLIGDDKAEIVTRARQLGTYDISIQSHSDCCTLFMPRKPETHAKPDEVHEAWALLDTQSWVAQICADAEVFLFDCPHTARAL